MGENNFQFPHQNNIKTTSYSFVTSAPVSAMNLRNYQNLPNANYVNDRDLARANMQRRSVIVNESKNSPLLEDSVDSIVK